jgi:signal peptidase I
MPVTGTKSYLDCIQWPYERVAGFGEIKLNDIVVFNYPAGDTVLSNPNYIDYYAECYLIGESRYPDKPDMDSLSAERRRAVYDLYYAAGKDFIEKHPEEFGEIMWRPVDRRENYVKRCVGMPGDIFEIKDKQIFLNGKPNKQPDNVQYNYYVKFKKQMPERLRRQLDISNEDLARCYSSYILPLTPSSCEQLKKYTDLVEYVRPADYNMTQAIYPLNGYTGWTPDNYGPVWIPRKGESVKLTLDNLPIYERPIAVYEGNKLEVKDGKIFINGEESDSYTFKMDYYWMMGDNRHNSADSRFWGFVPEDHIVGKPIFVWLSLDKDRGWFDGKIRWNRLFRPVASYN